MTDDVNMDQIEFWNGDHGTAWARYAEIIDVMFAEITDAVLDAAAISVGDRVLDLGCGNGGTTLAAADKVTPIGSVTAIDISAPMLERAQERAGAAGLVNATFILGDASIYPFAERSFDAMVSRLGAMFFDDPEETFRRMLPALDSGGRIALGVWRGPRENLWAMGPVAAAKDFLEMPPRPGLEDPGPFSFADPDRVRSVLGNAGLTDIKLAPLDFQIPLGGSLEEALNFVMEMGPLSAPLSTVTGDNRQKAIAAITNVLKENQDEYGIVRLAGACWIITARTP
jgi:SAM-dependent methyltransferase